MKRLLSLVVAIVICTTFGVSVFATSSPDGGALGGNELTPTVSPNGDNGGSGSVLGTGNGSANSGNSSTSPTTSDLIAVPGLVVVSMLGVGTAVISKKKMKE